MSENNYQIQIKKSFRKSIAIVVKSSSLVELRLPLWVNQKTGLEFVARKEKWINSKINWFANKKSGILVDLEDKKYSKDQTLEILLNHLTKASKIMELNFKTLKTSKAKSRWGYCKKNGTIGLNSYLINLEGELIDYVCIHELAHLVHFNHSKEFWNLVEKYCPDYKVLRKQLKNYHLG